MTTPPHTATAHRATDDGSGTLGLLLGLLAVGLGFYSALNPSAAVAQ